MNRKLLTLVIPVKDRADIIGPLLRRVAVELQRTVFDVIIVDNGSSDSTPKVVTSWIRSLGAEATAVRLASQPKPGASAARNMGLKLASTPYIMFFDSDDIFDTGHIERIVRFLEGMTPGTDAPQIIRWSVRMRATAGFHKLSPTPRHLTLLNHIYHASLATMRYCVSTQLLRSVGGWNEALPVWNDLEMGARLLLASPATTLLEGPPMVEVVPMAKSITGTRWADRWRERAASLDAIDLDLDRYGRPDLHFAIEARRMLLAATISAEGETAGASLLRKQVMDRNTPARRAALHLIYAVHRLFGRGGVAIASLFS